MTAYYLDTPNTEGMAARSAAKALRRVELLRAAAAIMSDRGFHNMRLEDLGEAVGISGPAVYRHFSSKEEILTELMTGISGYLLEEARALITGIEDPATRVDILIDFHISFALSQPELIRLHNREIFRVIEEGRELVRDYQGKYLQLWAESLESYNPGAYAADAGKITAQLLLGMLNSAHYVESWASPALTRREMSLAARAMVGLRS